MNTAEMPPEMLAVLLAGAANSIGICCLPGQVRRLWPVLREAERLGYIRFIDLERPWITNKGRQAIGAERELDASATALRAYCKKLRKPLIPSPDDDPRTDFDYRSYKACGYVCTLLVRQPDERTNATTLRVGTTLDSEKQFLGARNSIILEECVGTPFVLAVMPDWLIKRAGFPTHPFGLDEHDARWTEDDRATWDLLRRVCHSVNTRIRNAGRKHQSAKLRFGEFA